MGNIFDKKTIKDISLENKKVLLRADYNAPIKNGVITDDFRLRQSVPTIKYLLKENAAVIIISHMGRPKGRRERELSLRPVAKRLSELIEKPVGFVYDCVGPEVDKAVKDLKPGAVLLLENLRFHPGEEKNDDKFAALLAKNADVFVQDGFGVVHRAHASTDAITKHLPSVAGLLLESEVTTITRVMKEPKRPLVAIIGGAKIEDKIDVLKKFVSEADLVAVGGAMANTFLFAIGIEVGKSVVDKSEVSLAKDILQLAQSEAKKRPFVFYIPQDGVVASSLDKTTHTRIVDWSANVIAEIENYPKRPPHASGLVKEDELILDIGPFSGAFIAGSVQLANTVIWNGTMGVTETPALHGVIGPFAQGTELIVEAMLGQFGHRPFSLVGGGDTAGYVEQRGLTNAFDHVSTGGGASLELMVGKKLPGVEALMDK